jgi:hypothetical protein
MNYTEKYTKYKIKYTKLKKQIGGYNCNNTHMYKNILGTCWMIAVQMIFSFGDVTKEKMQKKMQYIIKSVKRYEKDDMKIRQVIDELIHNAEKENLRDIFLDNLDEYYEHLYKILEKFIQRYMNKVFHEQIRSGKPTDIEDEYNNLERCELIIRDNYIKLFKHHTGVDNAGGNFVDMYIFSNILSIFFLDHKVSCDIYYQYYEDNFKKIEYDDALNVGIIIGIQGHVCCFFICNRTQKYYNDNDKKIYDCNWKDMLSQLTNNKCLYVKKKGCVLLLDDNDEYIITNKEDPNNLVYKVRWLLVISKEPKSIFATQIYNAVKNNNVDTINDRSINFFLGIRNSLRDDSDPFKFWNKIPLYTSQNDNHFTRVYQLIADNFKSDGHDDKAIEYYDILLKTYIRNKNYEDIEETFNELNKLRNKFAKYYEKNNDYKNAIKYYEQIIMSENTISTLDITLKMKQLIIIMLSLSKLTKIYYRLYFSKQIETHKTQA